MVKSIDELARVNPALAVKLLMASGESRASADEIVLIAQGGEYRDMVVYDENGVPHPYPPTDEELLNDPFYRNFK